MRDVSAGVVQDPFWHERGQRHSKDVQKASIGSGSISTLGISAEEAAAAEARRQPIGFAAPKSEYPKYLVYDAPVRGTFLFDAVNEVMGARAEKVERQLRDLGECLWTARDTVVVYDRGGELSVGYP